MLDRYRCGPSSRPRSMEARRSNCDGIALHAADGASPRWRDRGTAGSGCPRRSCAGSAGARASRPAPASGSARPPRRPRPLRAGSTRPAGSIDAIRPSSITTVRCSMTRSLSIGRTFTPTNARSPSTTVRGSPPQAAPGARWRPATERPSPEPRTQPPPTAARGAGGHAFTSRTRTGVFRHVAAPVDHEGPLVGDDDGAVLLEAARLHGHDADVGPRLRLALVQHLALRVDRVALEDRGPAAAPRPTRGWPSR